MFNVLEFAFGEGKIVICIGAMLLDIIIMAINVAIIKRTDMKKYIAFANQSQMLILNISHMTNNVAMMAMLLLFMVAVTTKSYIVITILIMIAISDITISVMVFVVLVTLYSKNREN